MSLSLKSSQLNLPLQAIDLGFANTSTLNLDSFPQWIGQSDAEQAANFGLSIFEPGFNMLVLGESGSGRKSLTLQAIQTASAKRPKPHDLVLLYHFETPEKPLALYLNAGHGVRLRVEMDAFIRQMIKCIPALIAQTAAKEEAKPEKAASSDAESKESDNISSVEIKLAEQLKHALEAFFTEQFARLIMIVKGDASPFAMAELLKFDLYLAALMRDVCENIEIFNQSAGSDNEGLLEGFLGRFRVNVMVDNASYLDNPSLGSPVIFDDDPTFSSLFGGLESAESSSNTADFMRLRAGNLLKAHGGTLMLYLRDINADQQSGVQIFEKLHRFLRNGSIQIEEASGTPGPNAGIHFAPEALAADVKLVFIATREEYYALQDELPEFARYFQIKVDFVESMQANQASYLAIAGLIATFCHQHALKPFDANAVVKLIRFMQRTIDDQTRIGTRFSLLERLVLESAVMANLAASEFVRADDVQAALDARRKRHNSPERQLRESMIDGEVMINVTGEQIGQINGLTHIDLGDMSFGSPVRISARCYAGAEGVINIDREVAMTGPNHDKGLMILRSWLSASFSSLTPLSLTASLVFEQEYYGVEGDSASCAELYALLSALSGVPIKQGLAVTGAMNQHGEVMAIGGLNEKIEGYFRICKAIGLDGKQGVLIPSRNLAHLLLDDEVIEAVNAGQFHIYPVTNVLEAIELLTDVPAGAWSGDRYAQNSVLGKAQHHLETFRTALQHNRAIQLKNPR
ncbi:Lon protease family protein [Candidatus Methylopumilus turicensis]|uniref:endopeptidase La n=1 Tax=Candidatus Methylopumilus turicensis TaxID=1581680 RepID=A0A0B7IUN0_9PROT|nr:AAA family ATPase [Candidatus Methylopumilus turicensis]CEN56016.1 ATP-dependent protease-like protein [Candidatus Methylopumilus turicensis]